MYILKKDLNSVLLLQLWLIFYANISPSQDVIYWILIVFLFLNHQIPDGDMISHLGNHFIN